MLKSIKAVLRKWRNPTPPDIWLKGLIESESGWVDYQAWLYRYCFMSKDDWIRQRKSSRRLTTKPLLSILTPVYNVHPDYLWQCVEALFFQTYPYWELILVNDCSTDSNTIELLKSLNGFDSRVRVLNQSENKGICETTNRALSLANGDYCIFLDHDDKFAVNALFEVADVAIRTPETSIIYSDRDLISENGVRFMHLFKPGWAPETILSSNYLCHLTAYRTSLLKELGGLEKDTEGSQDHDLILRAQEKNPHVVHIPKILYHWRQHQQSVSLNPESKNYAYRAATLSIEKALKRRQLKGEVEEVASLWRGNYRVRLMAPPDEDIYVHLYDADEHECFSKVIYEGIKNATGKPYVVFVEKRLEPDSHQCIRELVSWFQIDDVSISTGKIIDRNCKLVHAGFILNGKTIESIYRELDESATAGYMAWTATAHNVSFAHPYCFAVRSVEAKKILNTYHKCRGAEDFYSFCLALRENNKRIVYTPFARFTSQESDLGTGPDINVDCEDILRKYTCGLEGDPYFNKNLTVSPEGIALNFAKEAFS